MIQPTFLNHRFNPGEREWLTEACTTSLADPREIRVKLRAILPTGFRQDQIASFFLRHGSPTLVTRRMLNNTDELIAAIDKVAFRLQEAVIQDPSREDYTSKQLAAEVGLSDEIVRRVFGEMINLGRFAMVPTVGPGSSYGSIRFTADWGNDDIVEWAGLDSVLERLYIVWNSLYLAPPIKSNSDLDDGKSTTGAGKVFVLMSFDKSNPSLEDSYEAIKDACLKFGLHAFRSDNIPEQGLITEQVLSSIKSCEHLIADLTGERPNVYYEIGFAHALGKHPILYRKQGTPLHFDLYVHKAPEYTNATDLRRQLIARFENILGRAPKAS